MSASRPPQRPALLEEMFEKHYHALLGYARRRTDELADAEEAVAQTFVVAWRRLSEVPAEDDQQRAWLYGVARRVLANQRRAEARRRNLVERLRGIVARTSGASGAEGAGTAQPPVLEALQQLSEPDREILRLVAWEGLSHAEAAVALDISPNAAAIRLHRARGRLKAAMQKPSQAQKESPASRTWMGWKGNTSGRSQRKESR